MSYHWFNRQEILQKAKEGCSKEKAAEYYFKNKEAIKEKSREQWKTCHKKKKTRLKSTKKSVKNWFSIKKKYYKINNFCFLLRIKRTSEKTLNFNNIRVNKKEFHKSKQPIGLISVNTEHIDTEHLTNLNIVTKTLNILLVAKKMQLLNHYVLSYLK